MTELSIWNQDKGAYENSFAVTLSALLSPTSDLAEIPDIMYCVQQKLPKFKLMLRYLI